MNIADARATLRPARLDDLPALRALEEEAFSTDRLSRRSFRRLLDSPSAALMVAEADRQVVGYALTLFRSNMETARLYSIAIARASAGKGIGRALLASAEQAALQRGHARMRLEVSATNPRAIDLYRRSGYSLVAALPSYYADGSDAIRYEKVLAPAPDASP